MAGYLGWTVWHDNDSRRNDPGLPDLLCVHPERGVVWLELKTERGRLRKEQRWWLDLLTMAGARAFVARPSQADDVERLLRGEIERLETA
jgi:hypothetical protein